MKAGRFIALLELLGSRAELLAELPGLERDTGAEVNGRPPEAEEIEELLQLLVDNEDRLFEDGAAESEPMYIPCAGVQLPRYGQEHGKLVQEDNVSDADDTEALQVSAPDGMDVSISEKQIRIETEQDAGPLPDETSGSMSEKPLRAETEWNAEPAAEVPGSPPIEAPLEAEPEKATAPAAEAPTIPAIEATPAAEPEKATAPAAEAPAIPTTESQPPAEPEKATAPAAEAPAIPTIEATPAAEPEKATAPAAEAPAVPMIDVQPVVEAEKATEPGPEVPAVPTIEVQPVVEAEKATEPGPEVPAVSTIEVQPAAAPEKTIAPAVEASVSPTIEEPPTAEPEKTTAPVEIASDGSVVDKAARAQDEHEPRLTRSDLAEEVNRLQIGLRECLNEGPEALREYRDDLERRLFAYRSSLFAEEYRPLAEAYTRLRALERCRLPEQREKQLGAESEGCPTAASEALGQVIAQLGKRLDGLERAITRLGMTTLLPEPGSEFDRAYHQAVNAVTDDEDELIIEECVYPGILLDGRVLSPAAVRVRIDE